MEKYQSYKSSGIEWIGEIPQEWKVSKVRYEGKIIGRIGYRGYTVEDIVSEEEGVITLSPSNITKEQKLKLSDSTYITREKYIESPEIQIFNGDLIIVKTSSLGKVTIIEGCNQEMTLNPQLVVYKQIKQNNKFIYYSCISNFFQYQLMVSKSGGVTPTITQEVINSFVLLVPPLQEQKQIVQFLDEKTELIDNLISIKERKINLLKEQRTSLINQLVTKGLNPNVKMKNTGIEWIGEIPEHWSILKINQFGMVTLGKMLTPDEKEGYVLKPYLRSQNIQKEKVDVSDVKEMWFSKSELEKLKLLKGDLLLNEGGDVGRTCIWNEELEECYIQNSVNRLRFIDDLQEYYLYLSNIYHYVGYYDSIVNRVSIPHLTKEKLESVKFIRPPKKEQQHIVKHLDEKTKEIDELVDLEQKKIDLLKEYRQSLISEVVTGKIKVTN